MRFPKVGPTVRLGPRRGGTITEVLLKKGALLTRYINTKGSFRVVTTYVRRGQLKLTGGAVVIIPGPLVKRATSRFLELCPSTGVLITARHSFRGDHEGRFMSEVTANSCSYVVVSRSRFRGVPVSTREGREVLGRRVSRVDCTVSRVGRHGKRH